MVQTKTDAVIELKEAIKLDEASFSRQGDASLLSADKGLDLALTHKAVPFTISINPPVVNFQSEPQIVKDVPQIAVHGYATTFSNSYGTKPTEVPVIPNEDQSPAAHNLRLRAVAPVISIPGKGPFLGKALDEALAPYVANDRQANDFIVVAKPGSRIEKDLPLVATHSLAA